MLWTRAHPPGAFVALRLEMNVAAPPSALLAVLRDTSRHQEWLPYSLEVRVLAKPAPDEDLVYTRLSAPWPVQERELITHSRLLRNADCSLQLTVWAVPDALPPHPGRVRIRASEGRWEALPQLNGTTLVRLETYTNPGDSLPSWIINPIATEAALDSFRAIRRLMEAMPPQPCACALQHPAGKWQSCQVIP